MEIAHSFLQERSSLELSHPEQDLTVDFQQLLAWYECGLHMWSGEPVMLSLPQQPLTDSPADVALHPTRARASGDDPRAHGYATPNTR